MCFIGRHRRSKHEKEGRIYSCECGKAYLSQPALNNHKKTKHPELNATGEKRGRGRPRKYLPNFPGDFETNKYDSFFNNPNRKKDETKKWELSTVLHNVFAALFQGEYKDKLFSHPDKIEDNVLLNNLLSGESNSKNLDKKDRKCDDVFYEYLMIAQKETNEEYFTLVVKFILLFRECFNFNKKKKEEGNEGNNNGSSCNAKANDEATVTTLPETLPELCNEFYTDFMESNQFFGVNSDEEKNEIIEIIQHFCIWLFKSEYTKSKLSLAQ